MTTVNLDVNTSTIRLRITVSHCKSVSIPNSSYLTNFLRSRSLQTMCFLLYTFSRGENYVLLKTDLLQKMFFTSISRTSEFRTLQLTSYFVKRNVLLSYYSYCSLSKVDNFLHFSFVHAPACANCNHSRTLLNL